MDIYSGHMNKLIEQLSRLPGVGAKSAQRLAFHIINMPKEEVEGLASAMTDAKAHIKYCKECFTLTDDEICPICANEKRDHSTIMVVEQTRDMAAYEKTGKYEGVYHVLHGAISPMLGIGPSDIKLKELMKRLEGDVQEVIIATNSSLEGNPHCKRCAGWRRFGIYRLSDTAACIGRQNGIVGYYVKRYYYRTQRAYAQSQKILSFF